MDGGGGGGAAEEVTEDKIDVWKRKDKRLWRVEGEEEGGRG